MIEDIVSSEAKIVGFTTYDVQLPSLLAFVQDLRRAGLRAHVTLGGLCASAIPERILWQSSAVDSVVFGEGEAPIVDLARRVIDDCSGLPPGVCLREDSAVLRGEASPGLDLDSLAAPALDDFSAAGASAPLLLVNGCVPMIASRGCYGRCTYCCIQQFYRRCPGKVWRSRSPARIADEITDLLWATGAERVTFVDENFMGPGNQGRRHAAELAEEIGRRSLPVRFNFGCRPNDVDRETMVALQDCGLTAVSLGVEGMSGDTLDLFRKGTTPETNYAAVETLDKIGIFVEIMIIFFHPMTTIANIRDNLRFIEYVKSTKHAYFNNRQPFSEFIPFFGTELTQYFQDKGLVTRDLDGYVVTFADRRVEFIARSVLGVPVDLLSALRTVLPADGSPRLAEIHDMLAAAEIQLTMNRLPELVSELCDLFEEGATISSARVATVTAEFQRETDHIRSLGDRFLALAGAGESLWTSCS